MTTLSLTWPQVIGRRLERHHLLAPAPAGDLVKVASDICGAHAQVAASAELMLGVRLQGVTRQDVRRALWEQRTLVKTVGLRGTLHLLPADEVPMWMAANRLRFDAEERRLARVGIGRDELHAVAAAIAEIVGPTPTSRPELERELEARVGGWAVTRNAGWLNTYKNWPMALGWAAANGTVCYGPGDGGRSTFVGLDGWTGWRDLEPSEGGRFALRRFLRAYGPSTHAEFSRWFPWSRRSPGTCSSRFATSSWKSTWRAHGDGCWRTTGRRAPRRIPRLSTSCLISTSTLSAPIRERS